MSVSPPNARRVGEKFGKAKGLLQSAARMVREAARRKPLRVNTKGASARIMAAKSVCKMGVPFGIVAPYALLCSLQNFWDVASVILITPPTMLRF